MVGPERELHALQLPVHQDAGVEIGHHADGLQVVGQGGDFDRDVEAGDGAHFRIAQRSGHVPQIIRPHAHVAVADDDYFVRGLVHQARELGDFVVGRPRAPNRTGRGCGIAGNSAVSFASTDRMASSSGSTQKTISYSG